MRGLTAPLWPIHFKPLPDELLSSWLVRLAHAHGLKIQTFCTLIFSSKLQLWNRDIDRLAPNWLLKELSDRTGVAYKDLFQTTLRSYEGWLYPKIRTSSTLQWITALKLHHRKFEGFGIQFCPQCLKEDIEPYFRKRWRVAFNTVCTKHNLLLHDRCQSCGTGAAFHRVDVGHKVFSDSVILNICHKCGFNLGESATHEIGIYNLEIGDWLCGLSTILEEVNTKEVLKGCELLRVMRQFAMLLTSRCKSVTLHEFICAQIEIPEFKFLRGGISFEARPINDRHHLVQLIGWLMIDLGPRLNIARRTKALRYNHLIKDFDNVPDWYLTDLKKFLY